MSSLALTPPTAAIARVVPLTRTRAVRGAFDYRLPVDPTPPTVDVGTILRVPFGGRQTLGVVVGLAAGSEVPADKLAEPAAVLPTSIPPDLVELAAWMADQYCSTQARALGLVLPPGAAEGIRPRAVLVAELTPAGRDALAGGEVRLTAGQKERLLRLDSAGPQPAAALGTETLRRLERRGLVALDQREVRRRPPQHTVGVATATPPPLTAEQESALDSILAALAGRHAAGDHDRVGDAERDGYLLHGVTGSGKTEVYLRAVAATLQAGRTAIILVPEIALTPQALGRFQARFGDVVAVLHSGLSVGERHDEWRRLQRGEARVCVGPRSAVFAPLPDLGLIVVDEEHESSYKHEGDPRYDARDVAAARARRSGAVLVCGSATPRPESFTLLRRLRLAERVDQRPMPAVDILDMRGHHHPLHPDTRLALADLQHAGGKAILLLNRRGWSNFLSCRACGRVWLCPDCEVALVLHRAAGIVACHHCGHREPVPSRCRSCGAVSVARHGSGTERIEHELRAALSGADFPIFRLDADAASLEDRAGTLQRFAAAPSGVMVGTQMVAKGHDFPDVTLGVVIDADQTLRFPDFRAEERTFSLITQLAGRTGRGAGEGRVLVQTLAPEARPLLYARRHDSQGFVEDELRRRRALAYPPYATLIRIVCAGPEEDLARTVAGELAAGLAQAPATVLGPAPLFRLRGRARAQLVIKTTHRPETVATIAAAVDRVGPGAARRGASISVDVDPQ